MSNRGISPASGSSEFKRRGNRRENEAEFDELIGLARAGSEAALDQLIEILSNQLWTELNAQPRRSAGPSHGSSDLVQDTLVRVRQQFARFERDTFADFKQWARAVLYRRRLEWSRNHQSRNAERHKRMLWSVVCARIDVGTGESRHVLMVEQREAAERAYATFRTLRPNEKFIIELRLLNGLSYGQIASMTETTEEAARKAYDRAIAKLRRLCDAHELP